jgi:IclR family transcriptional regulator, acetate operon repressor
MAIASREKSKAPAYPVGSVENALRLLLLLRDRPSIQVSEAAAELSVARSTAHRLLAMLKAYDVVTQDPRSRAYRPGPLLAELGLASLRHDDVLSVLHPLLEELSDSVGETVHAIVLDGPNSRFVDSVECRHPLRTTARIGVVYPAHVTSGGRALLAELGDRELRRLFPRRRLPQLTERSPASREELFEELERIRAQGYATNFGESELGIHAAAVAQRTSRGRAVAAIAVSAPEQRLPQSRVPELVAALNDVTARARPRLP